MNWTREEKLARDRILIGHTLVRATFSGRQEGAVVAWIKVVVRPVQIKESRHLQFSYFDGQKDITKNYMGQQAQAKVEELVLLGFKNIHIETTEASLHITLTKKGRAVVREHKREAPRELDLAHDHDKKKLLTAEAAAPFLQVLGITTQDGKIKADMQKKFRQINEFLRLIDETKVMAGFAGQPVQVVDLGCGSAHLTFAIYHYLENILGLTAFVLGVDLKADLVEQHREKAAALKWERLTFQAGRIADLQPELAPDVVLALHACDTATDDALAVGIRRGSSLIVSAPCCQHELQTQLCQVPTPAPFLAVERDGILNERLADILTDAFRAAILRVMGYRTQVIQFVSSAHSAKNLMIRAVKTAPPGNPRLLQEYHALKAFWHVTPYLERVLGDDYAHWLQDKR